MVYIYEMDRTRNSKTNQPYGTMFHSLRNVGINWYMHWEDKIGVSIPTEKHLNSALYHYHTRYER